MAKVKVKSVGIVEVKGLFWTKVEVLEGKDKGKIAWFYDGGYSWIDEGEIREIEEKDLDFEEPNWEELEQEIQ